MQPGGSSLIKGPRTPPSRCFALLLCGVLASCGSSGGRHKPSDAGAGTLDAGPMDAATGSDATAGGADGAVDGGASADAAGGREDGGVILPDDAPSRAILAAVDRALDGKPADFDGDGVDEYTQKTGAGGSLHAEYDADGDGVPEVVVELDKDGSGTIVHDDDGDGTADSEVTIVAGPPRKLTLLRDTNFDGVLDQKQTDVYDLTNHTVSVTLASDPEADGTFTTLRKETVSAGRDGNCNEVSTGGTPPPGGAPPGQTEPPSITCKGQDGFPSDWSGPGNKYGGGIWIPRDGSGVGRCSAAARPLAARISPK